MHPKWVNRQLKVDVKNRPVRVTWLCNLPLNSEQLFDLDFFHVQLADMAQLSTTSQPDLCQVSIPSRIDPCQLVAHEKNRVQIVAPLLSHGVP